MATPNTEANYVEAGDALSTHGSGPTERLA